MSKPDFGRDPERVALAQLMFHAVFPKLKWESMRELGQENYLAMADAAITHLGSGYVLPPATDENAERLARAWRSFMDLRFGNLGPVEGSAYRWLRALHAAFPRRQPKDDGKGLWIEPKDNVAKALDAEEKPVRDPVSRDEQREYEALVLQFAAAMAGDDSAEHVINLAVELADQYLEWRKMEREEFKRCKS